MDMRAPGGLATPKRRTHHLRRVPVLVLMPHSRCNCRCVMCDIWKGNRTGTSLSLEAVARLAAEFRALGVQEVVLSGGEPMMHADLWPLCSVLKSAGARITLLSTGLLLAREAETVTHWCDEVIVSLDGSETVHDAIRGIPRAFARLAEGVAALRRSRLCFPVSGRSVLQKRNFRDLPNIVAAAHRIGLDRISFLAADLASTAFNRPDGWDESRTAEVALDIDESGEFIDIIENVIAEHANDFASGFIAQRPGRMRQLGQYYLAVHGLCPFPPVRCQAPWVSTVIETDGTVRPCFFHAPIGNVHSKGLEAILNSEQALAFRENLDMRSDPICSRCVCTFNL